MSVEDEDPSDVELAWRTLRAAEVLCDGDEPGFEHLARMINLSDTWYWSSADGEPITDAEVVEVARLFRRYGMFGVYYWVWKERRNEEWTAFQDNNRGIQFVNHEETLRAGYKYDTEYACAQHSYQIEPRRPS